MIQPIYTIHPFAYLSTIHEHPTRASSTHKILTAPPPSCLRNTDRGMMNSYTWPRVNSVTEERFHPPSPTLSTVFAHESMPQLHFRQDFCMLKPRIRRTRVAGGTCGTRYISHRRGNRFQDCAPLHKIAQFSVTTALRRFDAFLLRTRGSGLKLVCLPLEFHSRVAQRFVVPLLRLQMKLEFQNLILVLIARDVWMMALHF